MLALGYDKLCGNGVAFEASLFLALSRSWRIYWSILKAGSAPFPCLTLLNTPNCCLTGYHPQCLLRKYLMTSARFLSPTQQVRLLGTSRILISRTCCLYGGDDPKKGASVSYGWGDGTTSPGDVRWCGPTNIAKSFWWTACEGLVLYVWASYLAGLIRVPLQRAHSS